MQPITNVDDLFPRQRAVRAFADRPVDDATVEALIEAATHAPSGSNRQPWRFLVVRDAAVKALLSEAYEEALAEAYGGGAPARGADRTPWTQVPVLVIPCVEATAAGATFSTGASIYPACQNLMLAARARGLGTVLTTLHRRRRDRFHAILGIPEGWESAAVIPLGWPDRKYGPNRRPPAASVIMHDRWNG